MRDTSEHESGREHPRVVVLPTAALNAPIREAIIAVCNRAFAHDPAHDFSGLFHFVTDSMHLLAFDQEMLVGHACWAVRWLQPDGLPRLRTAYVDAVATEPALQGRGIGTIVMQRFAREAAGFELHSLSSEQAIGFYERLGWERWLGPTAARTSRGLQPTPTDTVLIRRTPSSPALDLTARLVADNRGGQPW